MEPQEGRPKNFETDDLNPFARATLAFMNPLFRLGAKRPLEQRDVGMVADDERVAQVHARFVKAYEKERLLPKEKRSIWRAIFATIGWWRPLFAFLLQGIGSGCGFAPPLILKALTQHFICSTTKGLYYSNALLSHDTLWTLVCMLFVIPVTGTVCSGNSYVMFSHFGTIARNAIIPSVYKKALVVGSGAKATFSTGQIMNLFANDIVHIQNMIQNFAEPAFGLPQLAAALALIYQEMQVSMFVGLGLIVCVVPIMVVAILIMAVNRNHKIIEGDTRIKVTNEVLAGIRILRYMGWERAFEKKIDQVREHELKYLLKMNAMMPVFIFCIMLVPIVMPVLMFYCYISLGNQLDPSKTFTVISLFGLIMTPIYLIPTLIQNWVLAAVSAKRIYRFLESAELPDYVDKAPLADSDVVISLESANLSWLSEEEVEAAAKAEKEAAEELAKRRAKEARLGGKRPEPATTTAASTYVAVATSDPVAVELKAVDGDAATPQVNRAVQTLMDLSVTIRRGECVAIVGSVGSGKSSFLAGLLGELQPSTYDKNTPPGKVSVRGSVAYHSQVPWILNATVRDNILFGAPLDTARFEAAIEAACLGPDIAMLPFGLDTEIGERGINLSGGQKARVSFARTVYRDADLILLDDPLSAVDAHVGEKIFRHGIRTVLREKTVVLVTHQIHLIDDFDQVVILDGGRIKACGRPEEVKSFVEALGAGVTPSPSATCLSGLVAAFEATTTNRPTRAASTHKDKEVADISALAPPKKQEQTKGQEDGKNLMTTEEKAVSNVAWSVYKYYFDHGGFLWVVGVVFVAAVSSGVWSYSSFWLSDWGKENVKRQILAKYHLSTPMSTADNVGYFNIYACLNMLYVTGASFRTSVSIWMAYNASRNMHRQLLSRVLRAPVGWFDTTPLGRIINRFSADITQSDEKLGYTIGFFIGLCTNMIGIVITISITTNGYFAIVIPGLFYIYYHVQRFFRKTNTELKRLENISRSPILTEFSQALTGATSLRAFGEADKYVHRMERSVDENTTVNILLQIARWWLAIRLDFIGGVTSFFIAALCAGDPTIIPPEYLSLALQQAFSMTQFLKNMVQMGSDVEAAMSSIERVKYYSEEIEVEEPLWQPKLGKDGKPEKVLLSEREEDAIVAFHAPPKDWPSEGRVEFRDVSMRYRDGPLVLKNLSASLSPREKVGIAGRTGSGKSSLMVTLFRMSPLETGAIFIDGVDISKLPLVSLRSRLGIVPQDPVMFSATLRYNLDPFSEFDDMTIWSVLESVQLKEAVQNLPGELEFLVSEGGENFSTGQRQLINLARVLLRKPKVLVLDEATASIDNETDQLIGTMMKTKFQDCTVLTIAHRLHTIIDSDRIMTLSAGTLSELAAPSQLLENQDGLFAQLWAQHLMSHNHNQE